MSDTAVAWLFLLLAILASGWLYRAHRRRIAASLVTGGLTVRRDDQPSLYAIFMALHAAFIVVCFTGAIVAGL